MVFFGWTKINGLIEPKGWIFFRGKKHGAENDILDSWIWFLELGIILGK